MMMIYIYFFAMEEFLEAILERCKAWVFISTPKRREIFQFSLSFETLSMIM